MATWVGWLCVGGRGYLLLGYGATTMDGGEMETGFEVNPLANPKGIKLACHLCQKPARIQCPSCRLTYYW